MGSLPTPAQFTICKRSFLYENSLTFFEGIYHEDAEFKPRITYLADKIKTLNYNCYYYYQRTSGNIMSCFRLKNGLDLIEVINRLYDFGESVIEECKPMLYAKCSDYFNILSNRYYQLDLQDRNRICMALHENWRVIECMLKSNSIKYKVEGLAFMLNPEFGFWLYKITHK